MPDDGKVYARRVIAQNTELIRVLLTNARDAFALVSHDENGRQLWRNLQDLLAEFSAMKGDNSGSHE